MGHGTQQLCGGLQVFTGSLDSMEAKPLRPNSVTVPWPGHWHFHLGSPYFQQPFDADGHKAARQYLAMESLKVKSFRHSLAENSCSCCLQDLCVRLPSGFAAMALSLQRQFRQIRCSGPIERCAGHVHHHRFQKLQMLRKLLRFRLKLDHGS